MSQLGDSGSSLSPGYISNSLRVAQLKQKISQHQINIIGNRLYTSESDVCGRQILTYKDDPRTERIEIYIMVVGP